MKPCAIPKCKTGYNATKKTYKNVKQKCSVFKVPNNAERYKQWQAAIPGILLKPSHYVCEKHFEEQYIVREWVKRDANGRIIGQYPFTRIRLDESDVPTIFETNEAVQQSAASVVDSCIEGPSSMDVIDAESAHNSSNEATLSQRFIKEQDNPPQGSVIKPDIISPHEFVQQVLNPPQKSIQRDSLPPQRFVEHEILPSMEVPSIVSHMQDCAAVHSVSAVFQRNFEISNITINDPSTTEAMSTANSENCFITVPTSWGVTELSTERGQRIIFSHIITKRGNGFEVPVTQKSVMVDTDKILRYSVYGRAIQPEDCNLPPILKNTKLLPEILEKFKNMNVCNGLGAVNVHHLSADTAFKDYVDQWRQNECTLLSKRKRCDRCLKMRQRILEREARSKKNHVVNRVSHASNPFDQKKLQALRKKSYRERRLKNQAKRRGHLLRQSLSQKADEIAGIRAETLDERCSGLNVPAAQKITLAEIISAASKKGTNDRRYSEEWIMLCLLMNIRSPGYYEFLRKNNVLPLPCKRTIRSYFSLIDMKCGFDEQFGQLLKKHFDTKTPLQRHGVLLMDEINLRKSVTVCSKNLSYVGLTDFGNDGPQPTDIEDQATHGLVLMFQPLADSYSQPIAVFASKNCVKGEELSKLVVKAISFLEINGAKIHGVIGDGAATNAKMWSVLGVSGAMENTKTWFTHPLDDDRKVFVFSDTPHVFKCIRNRLYNKKELRVSCQFQCSNLTKYPVVTMLLTVFDESSYGRAEKNS